MTWDAAIDLVPSKLLDKENTVSEHMQWWLNAYRNQTWTAQPTTSGRLSLHDPSAQFVPPSYGQSLSSLPVQFQPGEQLPLVGCHPNAPIRSDHTYDRKFRCKHCGQVDLQGKRAYEARTESLRQIENDINETVSQHYSSRGIVNPSDEVAPAPTSVERLLGVGALPKRPESFRRSVGERSPLRPAWRGR